MEPIKAAQGLPHVPPKKNRDRRGKRRALSGQEGTTLLASEHLTSDKGEVQSLNGYPLARIRCPFFLTIVLLKNRPFPLGFSWFPDKKDPWKEWGRYPVVVDRGLAQKRSRLPKPSDYQLP